MTDKKPEPSSGSNAIVKIAEQSLLEVSEKTVSAFLNDKLNKAEMALFLNLCAMFQLNPFKREVYPIKYKANDPASFVIGYETYLKRAERTRNWAGLETGTEIGQDGKPTKAWARVFRKDWEDRSLYHEVYYQEYVQLKAEWRDGAATGKKVPNRMWSEKPITMLKKVAIAQAMRMAFPDEMAGLPYIEEELHLGEPGSIEHKAAELKERAEYEAGKRRPIGHVDDEFNLPDHDAPKPAPPAAPAPAAPPPAKPVEPTPEAGPDPDVDFYADAAEAAGDAADPFPVPTMPQLEKFGKAKAALAQAGVGEETLWAGIKKFCHKTMAKSVVETGDLTRAEMDQVLGYLNRWTKALEAEAKAKAKVDGK